ncbi:MAG: iron uptake transporter permease EfeU [Actinomycetota bacterium]
MGATFVIGLREGIEAALIVSILLAYLRKIGRADGARLVWLGTFGAVGVSAVAGTVLFLIGDGFEGAAENLFAGAATLSAVGVLTWMIFWMRQQAAGLRDELHGKVDSALLAGGLALAAIAFLAVLREGIETALFLFAAAKGTAVAAGGVAGQLLGALLGLATAVVLGALLYRGGLRLNLRAFFRVTGFALVAIGAGLLAYALHEFQEAGALPVLGATAYDLSATLPDDTGIGAILRGVVGYHASPSVLEVLAWLAYVTVVGAAYLRPAPARTVARAA